MKGRDSRLHDLQDVNKIYMLILKNLVNLVKDSALK